MKFKAIFYVFNTIIVMSFLLIFLMPLFILGADYAFGFWSQSWYLALIFVLVLGFLDGYFILNWRVFQLLEREDWTELKSYLADRLFRKKRLSGQNILLYINASLMKNELDDIDKLASQIREEKASLFRKYAVPLSVPVVLRHDGNEIVQRFKPLWEVEKKTDRDPWVGWNFGFGLTLAGSREEAVTVLLETFDSARRDRALKLLSLYLLKTTSPDRDEIKKRIEGFIPDLRKRYSQTSWLEFVQRKQDSVQLLIVSAILKEASTWAFQEAEV